MRRRLGRHVLGDPAGAVGSPTRLPIRLRPYGTGCAALRVIGHTSDFRLLPLGFTGGETLTPFSRSIQLSPDGLPDCLLYDRGVSFGHKELWREFLPSMETIILLSRYDKMDVHRMPATPKVCIDQPDVSVR
jgi:hypothetical protein